MKLRPLVSVLICSFNAQSFIEKTLKSVINQTYSNIEVLILDNNSKDQTVSIIKNFQKYDLRIRFFVSKRNLGAYPGLNYLLKKAKGKYIAIQDHDDIWCKDKLEKQISFLDKNQEYVGCGTAIINYYERFKAFLVRKQPKRSNVAWHTSFVYRNLNKLYNTSVKVGNDFLFMKHTLCQGKKRIYNFQEPCVLRKIRQDKNNLSSRWINFKNIKDILKVRLNLIDKVALLYRLIIPHQIADHLLIKIILRKNVISEKQAYRLIS